MCKFYQFHCKCCKKYSHTSGAVEYCYPPNNMFCRDGVWIEFVQLFKCYDCREHYFRECNNEQLPKIIYDPTLSTMPDFK